MAISGSKTSSGTKSRQSISTGTKKYTGAQIAAMVSAGTSKTTTPTVSDGGGVSTTPTTAPPSPSPSISVSKTGAVYQVTPTTEKRVQVWQEGEKVFEYRPGFQQIGSVAT